MTARTWQVPDPPDCPVCDSHGTVWTPTGVPGEWQSRYGLCTTWAILLADRGPLTEVTE